jgi:hypothetical protein
MRLIAVIVEALKEKNNMHIIPILCAVWLTLTLVLCIMLDNAHGKKESGEK